jgi:hypothetical protein
MSWVLITHHDEDLRGVIAGALLAALAPDPPTIEQANNLGRVADLVLTRGFGDCSLLVIGSTTPENELSSVGMTGRDPTLYLISEIKREWPQLPLVVLANTPNGRLADVLDGYKTTALVTVGDGLADALVARLRALGCGTHPPLEFAGDAVPMPERRPVDAADRSKLVSGRASGLLKLDIHLGRDLSAPWCLTESGGAVTPGILVLNAEYLEDVLFASNRLEEDVARGNPEWLRDMGRLSNSLRKLLFQTGESNLGCWEVFLRARERAGGIANTQVRVTLSERTHPMLVEALRDQVAVDDDYWMLSAPVFRRYELKDPDPGLFAEGSDNEVLNCLLIEADGRSSQAVDDEEPEEEFGPLSSIRYEGVNIARILRRTPGVKVERMQLGRIHGDDLCRLVLDKLAERRWHVVHFCGHTSGHARRDAGFVLRARPDGILPVHQFIERLNGTQLLFLSSCRSGSTRIVLNAVEQHVPAVIGFRWVIDDARASEFAVDYYRILFDKQNPSSYRSVEYAFVQARRAAYGRDKARIEVEKQRNAARRQEARAGNRFAVGVGAVSEARERETPELVVRSDPSWAAPMLVVQSGDQPWLT